MKHTCILLVLSSALLLSGCSRKHEEIDLSGIHSTASTISETMVSSLSVTETPTSESSESTESEEETTSGASTNVSAKVETFRNTDNGSISIQYPVVFNLSNSKTQQAVNELLLDNATAIVKQFSAEDEVTIDVTCKVISVDRSRLTVVYKGTYQVKDGAYPTELFYTNTVDLQQVKSLGFNDYSDAYTMAGYVMSDDVQFYQVTESLKQQLLEYRKTMSVEEYTRIFDQADFPLGAAEDTPFPESFSYTHEGVLYFSIPVPHALGDYAIVTFNIDGK